MTPGDRRRTRRLRVLQVAGVVFVGCFIAFVGVLLAGGGGDGTAYRPWVRPGTVQLGGTTVAVVAGRPGLGRKVADEVRAAGARVGPVMDGAPRRTTVVAYALDAHRQAVLLAADLHLAAATLRPLDARDRRLTGPRADVALLLGADAARVLPRD